MLDPHLDEEIDRAARKMLNVAAPPDLRAKVLQRIEAPRRAFAWALASSGVAAALLFAFLLFAAREPQTESARNSSASGAPAPRLDPIVRPAAPPRAAPVVSEQRRAASAGRPATAAARAGTAPLLPVAPAEEDSIPPLVAGEIVVLPPAPPADIEPAQIVIAPLPEPAGVTVEPLPFPPGARD